MLLQKKEGCLPLFIFRETRGGTKAVLPGIDIFIAIYYHKNMAGRPTKEPGGRMDIPLRIMLTAEQDRLIREYTAKQGVEMSTWARSVLLNAATTTLYLRDHDLTKAQASRLKDALKAMGAILYAVECASQEGAGYTHFMATSVPVDRERIEIICPMDKVA